MNADERKKKIAQYADGYAEVMRALEGFPAELQTEHPIPGKWSAREILHHLADSESTAALRLRKLLAEDHPVIYGYDQELFATRLHYNDRDHAPALEAFRAARATTTQLLQSMTDADWAKTGFHTESGPYAATKWLAIYSAHAHDHAAQIVRLREALAAAGKR